MIQFVSKDPEFQKEDLKLVGEEPTSVMQDEVKKFVRELPRSLKSSRFSKRSATNV
jgi:hypothetical protein